jgi:hypothetical protein
VNDRLFSPDYADPVDTTTQVDRMPGTADAECMCGYGLPNHFNLECLWPFCAWKPALTKENE